MNNVPNLALTDLVDEMLVEIGLRLDPGSLLSLSRVSTAFFRLFSPLLRRIIKETKYCKQRTVALGMSGSMALLRWASAYFRVSEYIRPRAKNSLAFLVPSQVLIGAAQSGDYEFLREYLSDPALTFSEVWEIEYPKIHMAAGRGGRWDLILYLQKAYADDGSMNHVAAGALQAHNIPLFLKSAPTIYVTVSHEMLFVSRNSWITAAIEALPFPSEAFAAFQRYFETVYKSEANQFEYQHQLLKLNMELCGLVLRAAVAVGKLGVLHWTVSVLNITKAQFSEIYLRVACSRPELLGPVFRVIDVRFELLDSLHNEQVLKRVLFVGCRCEGLDLIEYCLSKNVITGDLAGELLTEIASSACNAKSLAIMKALQALPGFTLDKKILDNVLSSRRSPSLKVGCPQELDVLTELVSWLKSLGAKIIDESLPNFFEEHDCLDTVKMIYSAFGDEVFPRDDVAIQQAFEDALDSDNLPGLLDFLHSKGFGVLENAYTSALLYICRRFNTPRRPYASHRKLLSYFQWLYGKSVPFDSDVLSWALALNMEKISEWLIACQCPRNNNVFSFTVLAEVLLTDGECEQHVIRLKAKVERLLASGYTFDGDTLVTILTFSTMKNLNAWFGIAVDFPWEASYLDIFIALGCPVTEKFFEYILGPLSSIQESERLKMVMKLHSLNCPRPPMAVSLACALTERTRNIQVLKFLVKNGYEMSPDITLQRVFEVLFALAGSSDPKQR